MLKFIAMKQISLGFLFLLIPVIFSFSQESKVFTSVKENDITNLQLLLDQDPTLVHARDNYNRTPLHWAARGVYPDIIQLLINYGGDVNARDMNQVTPIVSVVARNNSEALKLLIDNGARTMDPDIEGDYLIHIAASYGHLSMLKILLEHDDVLELRNSRGRTPLILACRESGDLETVNFLIEKGADINAVDQFGGTALALAAWRGYEPIVNLLLLNEVVVDVAGTAGRKLLQYACDKDLINLYFAIIENQGDIGSIHYEGQNALHWASMGGSLKIVKDLVSRGFDVNSSDHYGWTSLHYATYFGRKEVAVFLINNKADIEALTPLNETPYVIATERKNSEMANILLLKGAVKIDNMRTMLKGPFFGQKLPDEIPVLFAPGIASRLKGGHSNITFSNDGMTAFWTEWNLTESGYSDGSKLLYSTVIDGEWIYPKILYKKADCPVFSPDGSRIYFLASLPGDDGQDVKGIWYHEINGDSLSEPLYLDFDVQKYGLYWQFSFDDDGNLYFGGSHGLSVARLVNGKYESPERFSDIMHPDYQGGSPHISSDGDYVIFNSGNLDDSQGGSDLYVGFRMEDGRWAAPVNLGSEINSPRSESLARISLDGKTLFYKTDFGSVKWVSAETINRLRP